MSIVFSDVITNTMFLYTRVAVKHLADARRKLEENPESFEEEHPFLAPLLSCTQLSETEVNLLVTEIFQGGIDAVSRSSKLWFESFLSVCFSGYQTATTVTMMLHDLARNPHVQEAIYVDLKANEMKPGRSPPLLRACLKETLRLHPPGSANSRILDSEAIVSGYVIPAGVRELS